MDLSKRDRFFLGQGFNIGKGGSYKDIEEWLQEVIEDAGHTVEDHLAYEADQVERPKQIKTLELLACTNHAAACEWAVQNIPAVADFMATWGSHCGAPKDVFLGHVVKMITNLEK